MWICLKQNCYDSSIITKSCLSKLFARLDNTARVAGKHLGHFSIRKVTKNSAFQCKCVLIVEKDPFGVCNDRYTSGTLSRTSRIFISNSIMTIFIHMFIVHRKIGVINV